MRRITPVSLVVTVPACRTMHLLDTATASIAKYAIISFPISVLIVHRRVCLHRTSFLIKYPQSRRVGPPQAEVLILRILQYTRRKIKDYEGRCQCYEEGNGCRQHPVLILTNHLPTTNTDSKAELQANNRFGLFLLLHTRRFLLFLRRLSSPLHLFRMRNHRRPLSHRHLF